MSTRIAPEDMEAIMAEIARRLVAFNDYPFAFSAGEHAYVMRAEVFKVIAKAITQPPGKGESR